MHILLADDHDLLRDTLIAYLDATGEMDVTAVASYEEARTVMADRPVFDLVMLDYKMPGMRGLTGLREMIADGGGCRVALMSGEASREIAQQALDLGAAGFIPKTLPVRSFVNAVLFMAKGEQYRPPDLSSNAESSGRSALLGTLTPRELDVLRGVSNGKSNKEIARHLSLSEPTIKLHLKTLFRKLGVSNRTMAAILARQEGLE